MALIVEDGTGLATAESYASVAYADTYHSDRGNTSWATLTTGVKEQSLRKATDFMEQVYRPRWAGVRVTSTQALSWPRYEVPKIDAPGGGAWPAYYPYNAVPTEVKNACAELALKAAAGELAPDLDRPTTSETVGPISVTYAVGTRETVKYRAIDNLLAPLLAGDAMSLKVVRA